VSKTVHKGQFKSGVAARLAGIPVETLRVWERRYGITGRSSDGGAHRLYDQVDIDRLALLKRLVDLGQSIGTIAHLDAPDLQKVQDSLITLSQTTLEQHSDQPTRVALIGSVLGSAIFKEAVGSERVVVVAQANSLGQLTSGESTSTADVIFVEVPTLLDNTAADVQKAVGALGIEKIVLFYRFAPNALIRRLRSSGYSVVRMPFDAQEVVLLCSALLKRERPSVSRNVYPDTTEDRSPPKFSTETLLRLTQVKSGVYCECPSQLAELLMNVMAFERYSAQCASQTPEDAALHGRLEAEAAKVRKILENSITDVIRHENISI
jgi:MerR family transcriptional regulator, light-induced transcriptional regulator